MSWMAWTPSTALFFCVIAALIAANTVWAILSPSSPRRGVLPMETTRGDRLFVGLLGSAYINLAWAALSSSSQWGAVVLSSLFMLFIARWG
jgi:predicted small integral membrane protein